MGRGALGARAGAVVPPGPRERADHARCADATPRGRRARRQPRRCHRAGDERVAGRTRGVKDCGPIAPEDFRRWKGTVPIERKTRAVRKVSHFWNSLEQMEQPGIVEKMGGESCEAAMRRKTPRAGGRGSGEVTAGMRQFHPPSSSGAGSG